MAYNELAIYCDLAQWSNVAAWTATHAYSVGNIVRQVSPGANNERCFICVTAGTSLSTEPSWGLGKGQTTTETGGPKWVECTGQPGVNGDSVNTNKSSLARSQTIQTGTIIQDNAGTNYHICTSAGGAGASEPTYNTTPGATTTDSGVTWTCLGTVASFTAKWAAPLARLAMVLNNNQSWIANPFINIFLGDDHTEAGSSWSSGYPNNIICCDHTIAPPTMASIKTTAQITGTSLSCDNGSNASNYYYGIQWSGGGFGGGAWQKYRFDTCGFINNAFIFGNSAQNEYYEFKDSLFSFSNATHRLTFQCGTAKFENCVFANSVSYTSGNPLLATANGYPTQFIFEGCDFSGITFSGGSLFGPGTYGHATGYACFKDCVIPAGMPVYASGDSNMGANFVVDFNRCDFGAAGICRNERHSGLATETTALTVVRTGGAIDGTVAVAHQITTFANTQSANFSINNTYNIFNAIPLTMWNAVVGGSRSATIYGIVNDSRVPNNDEVWFDTEFLTSATTPKGGYARGFKANVLAAASPLTPDTSAWDSFAVARANSTAYSVGDSRKVASNPGRVFFCTTAGTSAASEPGGYASAVDGGSVADGTATFRAGCRFLQTVSLTPPSVGQRGYLYVYPRFGRSGVTYYIDPLIALS